MSVITHSSFPSRDSGMEETLSEVLYDNWDICQYYRITKQHIVLSAKQKKTNNYRVFTIIHNLYFRKKLWKDLIHLSDSKLLLPQKIHAGKDVHILEFPVCTSLKKLVHTNPVSLLQIINLILDLSSSLICLHDAGILHMDISVDNIYLTKEERFILGDFSESCYLTDAHYPTSVHNSSVIAPECPKDPPSTQSEQYQLGILFYQLCNLGNAPPKNFQGIVPRDLPAFQSASELSDSMHAILSKMLAQNPMERYKDLSALQQDLKSLFTQNPEQSGYQLFLPDETHPFHQTITMKDTASAEIRHHPARFHLPPFSLPLLPSSLPRVSIPFVLFILTFILLFIKGISTTGNQAKQITKNEESSIGKVSTGTSVSATDGTPKNTDAILDIAGKNIDSLASLDSQYIQGNDIHTLLAENNQISTLSELFYFPHLREIYLSNNQIADLQDLAALPDLEIIVLSDNCCMNLSGLKSLQKLRFLDLSGNSELSEVSDLHSLTSLETLILSDTSVSEDAVKQLQQILPNCNIIF